MPIYEYRCLECDRVSEILVFSSFEPECPLCGSKRLKKIMSPTSSLTGRAKSTLPGPGDTGCCGNRPGESPNCSGPGSCCGKV